MAKKIRETEKSLLLEPEKHYTPAQLKKYLQEKFSNKTSGKPFTNADIYQYSKRGKLPDEYGGNSISIVINKKVGNKLLKIS